MGEIQSRRVIAGFALMLGLTALLVAVFLADRIRVAFQQRYTLYAVFPSAPRLRIGSSVWIGGHKVGEVVSIGFRPVQPDSSPSIAVRLEIPRKYQSLIRSNSEVKLSAARMIGEPVVDIIPGDGSAAPLEEGDTLFAESSVSAAEAFASMRRFTESLDSLLQTARALGPVAAKSRGQFARLAGRLDQVQFDFGRLKSNLAGGSLSLVMNDSALQHAIAQTRVTTQNLSAAFQAASTRFADPGLRQAFAGLQQRASGLSAQMHQLQVQFANGSLPRFAQDSAIVKALHGAQVELDSLIAITRRNPLRFWFGDRK